MTWVRDSELRKLLIWRTPYQSTCISFFFLLFLFFFWPSKKEITPWRSSTEEKRHHMPLLLLHSCFYLYGEVCAKNSSKRSSGISAKLLGYITEQSIDTLGWTGPPLIASTHNFKYCRVLLDVESLYSVYLWHSGSYFESFQTKRSRCVNDGSLWQLIEIFQRQYISVGFLCMDKHIKSN